MRLSRCGFTLVELVVALAVASIAIGLIIGTLARQQKFYGAASEVLDVRAQLRDASDILVTDIRGAAVASFGLPVMTDSAVEMYASVASSIVCAVPSTTSVTLPPLRLASGNSLTSMLVQPDTGDVAMVYLAPAAFPDSGRWESLRIAAFATRSVSTSCPASTGFTSSADASAGSTAYLATFIAAPALTLRKGAPIHFVRRGRYSLYRSSDSKWYLGYRRCNAIGPPACAAIQPVSGPYDAYAPGIGSGLTFKYFDASGAPVSSAAASQLVARVDIVVRGRASANAKLPGDTRLAYRDSAIVSVAPRNRSR